MDNVDITPDVIYEAYWTKKILPKTAAINVEEYKPVSYTHLDVYKRQRLGSGS